MERTSPESRCQRNEVDFTVQTTHQRLTKPSTGVRARLMRQLYLSVALPKITYGIDIWYTPPY